MKIFICLLHFCCLTALGILNAQPSAKIIHELNDLLVDVVMHDVYTPPVASRIYAYPNIVYYECIRRGSKKYKSLAGKINDYQGLTTNEADVNTGYNDIIAALAFSYVAQKLVGSENRFESWRNAFLDSLTKSNKRPVAELSIGYAQQAAATIMQLAAKDHYAESRTMPRFLNSNDEGAWQLTPADYAAAIEPHWATMRTFTLDSLAAFLPAGSFNFSKDTASLFYRNLMDLYKLTTQLDTTKKEIAKYWDDNPNVSVNAGHLNYFIHKISPGGHWLMIAKQAGQKTKAGNLKSAMAYALTAIALYDAFIATWDLKYKTNLIRPITVINRFIDARWEPYIQTPPFPEFPSGHAVISNAAATVLTRVYGKKFQFTDRTEIPFGYAPKTFSSFFAAADEVSWSRVYGGIHYPYTASISIEMGKNIGRHVLQKTNLK